MKANIDYQKWLTLSLIILIGLILVVGMFKYNDFKNIIKIYDKQQKEINDKILSYEKELENQQKKIEDYQNKIQELDFEISKNNRQINIIYENAKIKKNSFKSYDARMWERYFTERYNYRKKDSTKK